MIDRSVYNVLDWIGDVGGLGEGCFFISFTLLGIIHFGAVDNMIIHELFRVNSNDDQKENNQQHKQVAQHTTATNEP